MNIFLTSAYLKDPIASYSYKWLLDKSKLDEFNVHKVTDNPEDAEAILFVENHPEYDPYFIKVLQNKIYRKYKHKVYLYNDRDRIIPLIKGIFPSIERKNHIVGYTYPAPYIARLSENKSIKNTTLGVKKKYLYSFIGSTRTHSIRDEIIKISFKNSYIKNTNGLNHWAMSESEKRGFEREYVDICHASSFVLCPRGFGPSTYRLYEMLEMGIPPVIISDEWIPIPGIDWSKCSIRIPEKDIGFIPEILSSRRSEAEELGCNARKVWEESFSSKVVFHRICNLIQALKNSEVKLDMNIKIRVYRQFFSEYHIRRFGTFLKRIDEFLSN